VKAGSGPLGDPWEHRNEHWGWRRVDKVNRLFTTQIRQVSQHFHDSRVPKGAAIDEEQIA
jgi:hypothetical protein